jgi:lysophospholipase L1-like esterase
MDTLNTCHTSNFRVLWPNKILGIGPWQAELLIEDVRELAAMWVSDPVHPSKAAYQVIADGISRDLMSPSRFRNKDSRI